MVVAASPSVYEARCGWNKANNKSCTVFRVSISTWTQGVFTLAFAVLLPLVVDFAQQHPGIEIDLLLEDRATDSIAERIDATSAGALFDTTVSRMPAAEVQALTGHAPPQRELADVYPGTPGEQMGLWDLHHYLPGDVLTKVDRTTMACSIEGREPLLDHRLVEFAVSLPFAVKRGALGGKHLLKKVLYRHVPRALVERPKRGFAVPIEAWLRGALSPLVAELLDPREVTRQGLFDPERVQGYVKRLHAGDAAAAKRVWLLLAFQLWHRRWM